MSSTLLSRMFSGFISDQPPIKGARDFASCTIFEKISENKMSDELIFKPFSSNCRIDLAPALGFSSTDNDAVNENSYSINSSNEAFEPPVEPRHWISRSQSVSFSLDEISSPLDALDRIRISERNDFQTNGIDMELDEFDLYKARLREAPPPEPVTKLHVLESADLDVKRKKKLKSTKNTVCVFCKNNGETLSVYGNHLLKDGSGRVTCPILRRYTCPICGAVGDTAHTIKYCPLNTNPTSCLSLLRTPRTSNGKSRFNFPGSQERSATVSTLV